MTMRLAWGSITPHRTRTGALKFRARAGDESRTGLGLYETRDDAEIALDEARRATEAIERASGPSATFAAYGRAWLDKEEKAGIRRGVDQERSRFGAHLELAPFARFPVATIEQRDVQRWMRALVSETARGPLADGERPISRETAKRALALFRSIMRSAVIDGIIDVNPGAGVVVPRGTSTVESWTWLAQEEIDAILTCDAISVRSRSIFACAIFTGCRAGELYGLRWDDVHPKGKHPEIVVRYSRSTATKSGRVRRVPLLAPAIEWLARWKPKGGSGLVWPSPSGSHHHGGYDAGWKDTLGRRGEDGKRKRWPGARTLAGITRPVRFHDFRHTCGSQLVSGTAWVARGWVQRPLRLEEVQQWLGHDSIETTKIYAHLAPEALRRAIGRRTPRRTPQAKKRATKARKRATK